MGKYNLEGLPMSWNQYETLVMAIAPNTTTTTFTVTQSGSEVPAEIVFAISDPIYDQCPFCPPGYFFDLGNVKKLTWDVSLFTPMHLEWEQDQPVNAQTTSNWYLSNAVNGWSNPEGAISQMDMSVFDSVFNMQVQPGTMNFGGRPGAQIFAVTCSASGQTVANMTEPNLTGGFVLKVVWQTPWARNKVLNCKRKYQRTAVVIREQFVPDAPISESVGGTS